MIPKLSRYVLLMLLISTPVASMAGEAPQASPQPGRVDLQALRLAVEDLTASYGDRYPKGKDFLGRIDALSGAQAQPDAAELAALSREALLANPLLDFDRLLLVKRGVKQLGLSQNWESNSSLPQQGYDNEIAVLSPLRPDGQLTMLYRPEEGRFVGDVDLHFDGNRMLFSMPGGNGQWQVFEMGVDGSEVRQLPLIEEPDVSNYDACYLPSGDILFTSTAPFVGVPCVTGSSHVSNIYLYKPASGNIRRLTFEQDHDWCPTVLNNGRVLYLRWEYSDIPHFVSRILFHMNPDGTEQMEYYGSNSYWPNAMFYARPVPNHPTMFAAIVGGHHDVPRMGELVLFDPAKGRKEADGAIQRIPGRGKKVEPILLDGLVKESWPKFLHPYPLSDKYLLVSAKPTPESKWGIYLVDVFDNMTLIKEIEGYALFEPLPLRKTATPPVVPDKIDPDRKDAVVYMADVYVGDGLKGVPRGTVKQLRLFTYHFAYHGMGGQVNRVGLDGPWDIKRIIGTVPVEEDGSASFRVPANTPISIQPLDANGQALQLMRSWMTAMPGEVLSCVGCHEKQNTPPPSTPTAAARRAPSEITPWHGPTRGFSFVREVQPVLNEHCVKCHNGSLRDDAKCLPDFRNLPFVHPTAKGGGYNKGTQFPPAYLALRRFVRGATMESDMHLLTPGEFHADTTYLVQMLRKGHHCVQLDPEAWDRLNTWIDLNTPAHGTWHEIVGEEKVNHQRDRRRVMLKKYAGIDEDPEAIFVSEYAPVEVAGSSNTGAVPSRHAKRATRLVQSPSSSEKPGTDASEFAEGGRNVSVPSRFSRTSSRRAFSIIPAVTGVTAKRSIQLAEGINLDLVLVPAGQVTMGNAKGAPDERPARAVSVPQAFWMGAFEVTNEQFALFDSSHDSRLEHGDFLQFSTDERGFPVNGTRQPVARVSWEQAMAFCAWVSRKTGETFSLPTEAEWEYACRAGTATPLSYGALDTPFEIHANLADASLLKVETYPPWSLPSGAVQPWRPAVETVNDGHRVSAPVGSYAANPWGLFDMHGNVGEWTRSVYAPYPYDPADGRNDAARPGKRVVRGGSWYDVPKRAQSSFRLAYDPWRQVFNVGFRVACPATREQHAKSR